ncbi:MAG TPA: ATP-binding protein [bacterium]|nr:ATP-binding protein [bacterium]
MQKNGANNHRLSPEQLRWTCEKKRLGGITSCADVPPCKEIIGQERALRAIRLGLKIKSHGYNIYVSGLTGTGKSTTVKKLLEQMDSRGETPDDICYVNNFSDADSPRALFFPAGKGKIFSKDMDRMIEALRKNIPLIYENDSFKSRTKSVVDTFKNNLQEAFQKLEEKVKKQGMAVVQVQAGFVTRPEILPVIDGQPVPWQKLAELVEAGKMSREEVNALREKHDAFLQELEEMASYHHDQEKQIQEQLLQMEKEAVLPSVETHVKALKKKHDQKAVSEYLNEVQNHILENLASFKQKSEEEKQTRAQTLLSIKTPAIDPFLPYKVNTIVDNSKTKGVPIVIETAPTFNNLFGMIERSWDPSGIWRTDFTKLKAGSMLRANGGYLVFNLVEAIAEPGVWKVLKRILKNRETIIQGFEAISNFFASALKPEPIGIDVKVLVIGDEYTYRLIYEMDDEFKKIFKVRADFDTVMENNDNGLKQYLGFSSKICRDENLLPLDDTGLTGLIEYGVLLSGNKKKLSTRFSDLADLMREAHFYASEAGAKKISVKHIDRAIEEKEYRLGKIEGKIQEMIEDGTLLIDVKGKRVGQVNGLSVYNLGDYVFGKPSRITAETAMGKAGIINIEREAGLGGSSYNKGVLILSGYLRRLYAQDKPLAVSASLCFEQSYSGVDGDSASSTEIYALLSALSDVPLRQDIAVTGSVNQKGEIQAIGGVNYKIQGFYDVCRAKGLSGSQGVLIPRANIDQLMLRKDVVNAVKKGRFHIWAAGTVDEGIELLTGEPAGKRENDGRFTPGSIHDKVDQKIRRYAEALKGFHAES